MTELKGVHNLELMHIAVKRYSGLMDWLTTVDHKKIGILYMIAGWFFFLVGGFEAILIRIQLMKPMNDFVRRRYIQRIDYDARNDDDLPGGDAAYCSRS